MGPIPAAFSLEKFIGRQLNQICIGPSDLQFRFDGEHVLSCQGRVVVELEGKSTVIFERDEPWWADVTLLPLLAGREALSWRLEGSYEFSLSLGGGARLRFQSTDCPFEEFFLIHPEMQVVQPSPGAAANSVLLSIVVGSGTA